jgi:lipopolysaccharide/colanic/teichoic acid biosynthesis glycosyltransferase
LLLLLLLSPLLAALALAVRLGDRGPVFFLQQRPGLDAKLFKIWKFRTMVPNADRFVDRQGRVTVANRVTPVGRFLRRTSLDELPQLINILLGEMSFIGPRPISLEHLHKLKPAQRQRFRMKPGVTGLAQINGRNTLKWSKRIEYDIEYIERYSLWLDLMILARTVPVVLTGAGIVLDRNPEDVDDLRQGAPDAAPPKAA